MGCCTMLSLRVRKQYYVLHYFIILRSRTWDRIVDCAGKEVFAQSTSADSKLTRAITNTSECVRVGASYNGNAISQKIQLFSFDSLLKKTKFEKEGKSFEIKFKVKTKNECQLLGKILNITRRIFSRIM